MDAWPQKGISNVERNADIQALLQAMADQRTEEQIAEFMEAEEGDCEANDDEDDADEDEEEDEDDDEEVGGCPLDVVYTIVAEQSCPATALLDDGWVCTSVVEAYALRTGLPFDTVLECLDIWVALDIMSYNESRSKI